MDDQILNCAIYIRVSTAEQQMHGKSLQAQKDYLESYAHSHNMHIAGIYADEGKTARKEFKKRKAIHNLLNDIKERKINVILFWKMDRWFRNVADFYKVQDILDEYQVKWIAVAEPNINLNTREGRLNLNIILSIGQNEVDTTSERIKFTVDNMIQNKRLVFGSNNMPFGYKIGLRNNKKCMVKDPDTSHIVNEIFEYFSVCRNKTATIKYIQNKYSIHFTYNMLRTMLKSQFYTGKYRGVDYCEPYLTEEEWENIQKISKNTIKSSPSGRIYLFSGLIYCPQCHQKLSGTGHTVSINNRNDKRNYCYYRCNKAASEHLCPFHFRLSQNLLEDYLLNRLNLFTDFHFIVITGLKQIPQTNPSPFSENKIRQEIERLNYLFQKSRISINYYNREYDRLNNRLTSEETKRSNISDNDNRRLNDLTVSRNRLSDLYYKLNEKNRQVFWHNILQEIVLSKEGNIKSIIFLPHLS